MFFLMKEIGFSYRELQDMELIEMHKWMEELNRYNDQVEKKMKESRET